LLSVNNSIHVHHWGQYGEGNLFGGESMHVRTKWRHFRSFLSKISISVFIVFSLLIIVCKMYSMMSNWTFTVSYIYLNKGYILMHWLCRICVKINRWTLLHHCYDVLYQFLYYFPSKGLQKFIRTEINVILIVSML